MKIDSKKVDFVDEPLELATRSDGAKMYLIGYSREFNNEPVASLEPNRGGPLKLLAQFVKFSQPDDWQWNDEAVAQVKQPIDPEQEES